MAAKRVRVLLDTNVWLDKYIPGRPGTPDSRKLISLCAVRDIDMLFPLRSLADVYWQVMRDRKAWVRKEYGVLNESFAHAINDDAWDCVNNMMEIGTPVGADCSDVWIAQKLHSVHSDFEDNMVLASAIRVEADYLITSDRTLIQKATVAALTPKDFLALLREMPQLGNVEDVPLP